MEKGKNQNRFRVREEENRSMGKEEGAPQNTRRTTRSSSLAAPAMPSNETQNPPVSHDLLFSEEPINLEPLLSSLPGRRPQIIEILRLIGPPNSPMLPLLLYGGPSTGKTRTILQAFRHLNRPLVYASCRSCYSPRILFESVLNQLLLHKRSSGNGYSSAERCERASEFIHLLRGAMFQAIDCIRERAKKQGSKEPAKRGNGEMIYLVFDNVELIRSWDKSTAIMPLLFKIYEILKIPQVGLIYISSSAPDAYYSTTGSIEPVTVYFPDYTVDDLQSIFMRNQDNPKLYSSFLSVVLKPFFRVTRRVDELSIAFQPLFQKYCQPLTDLNVVPDEGMKRKLFDNLQPHLAASLNEIFEVPSHSSHGASKVGACSKKGSIRKPGGKEGSTELDFHMSVSAKYLLLSAFLASRNPATLDASLFDTTGGSSDRKRKRKSSQTTINQKDSMAQQILMKGPGSFPLERMLAIFQCITSVAEGPLEENSLEDDGVATEGGNTGLMSDVLLQLSTLCNANFLCKSGSCPLEGSTRYHSTIDEEMALKVARSVNFPLSKYLYRR